MGGRGHGVAKPAGTGRRRGARPWALGALLIVSLPSCAGEPKRDPRAAPGPEPALLTPVLAEGAASATPPSADRAGCIVVRADAAGEPAVAEGVLREATGEGASARFVLRLVRPRCVVGLERASYVTEVYVVTTGPDLRPLVDARLRIRGDAIGGTNDVGGPAIVLMAKDFERLAPDEP